MTLPTPQIDVWKPATEEDQLKALILLAGLPSRAPDDEGAHKAAYFLALEGVTRYGLQEAVRVILKGGLNHTFFPTPVELRMKCDSAMAWHQREHQRVQQRLAQTEENRRFVQTVSQRTPEGIARQQQAYATFCAGYKAKKAEERIHLDPELVAQVPDAPSTFRRPA